MVVADSLPAGGPGARRPRAAAGHQLDSYAGPNRFRFHGTPCWQARASGRRSMHAGSQPVPPAPRQACADFNARGCCPKRQACHGEHSRIQALLACQSCHPWGWRHPERLMASAGTSVCHDSSAIEAHLPEVDLESRGVPEDIDQFTQSALRDLRESCIQPFALGFDGFLEVIA